VLPGPAAAAVIDATGPDDVVLTSHGRSGVRRWLLGSVAEKLVRLGTVPTIVVPAGARRAAGDQG
jgi:nucleotide-binding universal stress UspA family protein